MRGLYRGARRSQLSIDAAFGGVETNVLAASLMLIARVNLILYYDVSAIRAATGTFT
jgi:hypothetical protein